MKCNTRILFRFPETTTPEELEVDCKAAVIYGDHVVVADRFYDNESKRNAYFAAVYSGKVGQMDIESCVSLTKVSEESFPDAGHALEWGFNLANLLSVCV